MSCFGSSVTWRGLERLGILVCVMFLANLGYLTFRLGIQTGFQQLEVVGIGWRFLFSGAAPGLLIMFACARVLARAVETGRAETDQREERKGREGDLGEPEAFPAHGNGPKNRDPRNTLPSGVPEDIDAPTHDHSWESSKVTHESLAMHEAQEEKNLVDAKSAKPPALSTH